MIKKNIVFNRVDIKKLDLRNNLIELAVLYSINEAKNKTEGILEKSFNLGNNTISFVMEMMKQVRDKAKIEGAEVISFGRTEDEEKEIERLANGMKKISDTISKLKNTKDAQQYMKLFHSVNNLKVIL
ncbi:hypothetical protein HZA33_01695 [Candidatus Pacearchaeota archaeon]|nr:hypothetical protein [Candidatus Pacearchaeota archaeon]